MKIIITVNTYYPLTDGVQFVTQYHAEGLVKLGHEVTVVTVQHDGLADTELHNGVKIIRYNIQTKHAVHVGEKGGYRNLITSLCTNADVLLNVSTQTATTEVLFPILKKINIKKILYMHGMHDFSWRYGDLFYFVHKVWNNIRWGWDYLVNAKYFKMYDSVIQLHELDEATLFFKKKYNIDSLIIENAAEDSFFESSSYTGADYLLNVSNFDSRKNQEMLLESFYKIKNHRIGLILVGSKKNKYSTHLKKLKNNFDTKYGKRDVNILDAVPRDKIVKLVQQSKIYVMGSKWEAFPISIIEAMAAGKPFVSTDTGVIRFLPGGVTVKGVDEMVYWINTFLDNPQLASKYGMAGQCYARNNFMITRKVEQLNDIIGAK
ncbi:glycosyltransferase family 4 protein [Leuconostoc mesenteroides]|uniref:glycosyltransferase family 4 protein n=1 Tax=Leuconostoc mesenteroides TaxID=1245 RepID=UPI001CBD2219|nr:glycosyltransferase family 4 protein [Leuconostoc mesenteroides]MBZ1518986.1 glycosyltransferase family 4 protein [Leuconostoc mesenteroides]MBZ1521536.1 glycosyltransferase family 4 protein [Leuconostoc mesenteroides]MBZ1523425.1 glycosyltransferase family 4 protein [Leuconostoc mesenteroides]